ncbi:unnamed protein product [Haemonchus placei]|uniref:F5/8 type C domain-containing protein n=1 Tax=Haemonchus placei TaxID=6290 RepID=A0A0N4WZI2_HAEPC|nr:unnamed protein product [Haemonchus placei]
MWSVWVVVLQAVTALRMDECEPTALGMESGAITDAQITSSSSFDRQSVGPQNSSPSGTIQNAWASARRGESRPEGVYNVVGATDVSYSLRPRCIVLAWTAGNTKAAQFQCYGDPPRPFIVIAGREPPKWELGKSSRWLTVW